jgi:hypothetical protein
VADIMPVEYFLRKFNNNLEHILTVRWLTRLGLSENEIGSLSLEAKEHFYENVKSIYELNGSKKIKFRQRKIFLAAFEPRKILSATAGHIKHFDNIRVIWEQLFKVNRCWGTYKLTDAKPYIQAYQKAITDVVNELTASKQIIAGWQLRSQSVSLSERNEPGADFFYDSERFFASGEVLRQINLTKTSWRTISQSADKSASELVDHGLFIP